MRARCSRARDQRLTRGQRYHFVAGWLPWLADGLNLLFTIAALVWSFAMIFAPHRIDPPLIMFSALPLALFTFKLVKLAHLYAARVGANIRQTLAAAVAGLALSHTIGVAVVKGLFTRNQPFFRTPKNKQPHALAEGFAAARTESLMLIAMLLAALGLTRQLALGPDLLVGIPEELQRPGCVGVGRGADDPGGALRRSGAGVAGQRDVAAGALAGFSAQHIHLQAKLQKQIVSSDLAPLAILARDPLLQLHHHVPRRRCSPRARTPTDPCRSRSASCRRAASRSRA